MDIITINPLRFEYDGRAICFEVLPKEKDVEQKYRFFVHGDLELTGKLRACVKNKEINFQSIPYCAKALFQIIREGIFPILISERKYKELVKDFWDNYHKEPRFEVEDLSEENKPHFRAILQGTVPADVFAGEGRHKKEAFAQALVKFFDVDFVPMALEEA